MGLFGVKGFSNWNGVMYLGMDIAPGLAWDAIPPPRVGYLPPPCSAAATATLAHKSLQRHCGHWHQPPASPKRATPAPRNQARRIRAHGSRGNNSPSTSSRPNSRDFPMHHPKHRPTDPLPRSVPSQPNDDKRGKTAVNHHRRGHLLTSKVPYLPTCPGSICIHHSPYATACVHVLCMRRRR